MMRLSRALHIGRMERLLRPKALPDAGEALAGGRRRFWIDRNLGHKCTFGLVPPSRSRS